MVSDTLLQLGPSTPGRYLGSPVTRGNTPARCGRVDKDQVILGRLVGSGGFGSVHVASLRGRTVAVKTYHKRCANPRAVRQSYMSELLAYRLGLKHRNVVSLLGATSLHGYVEGAWIVMDYVGQRNLHNVINDPRHDLPPARTLSLALQMSRGLHYLHSLHIVHQDLKPANCLLSTDLSLLRIADFGCCLQLPPTPVRAKNLRGAGASNKTVSLLQAGAEKMAPLVPAEKTHPPTFPAEEEERLVPAERRRHFLEPRHDEGLFPHAEGRLFTEDGDLLPVDDDDGDDGDDERVLGEKKVAVAVVGEGVRQEEEEEEEGVKEREGEGCVWRARNELAGTLAYRAPELLRGMRPCPRSDVYSLGITLWQMHTRQGPYEGVPAHAVVYQVVSNNLRPPSHLLHHHQHHDGDENDDDDDEDDDDDSVDSGPDPFEIIFAELYTQCWAKDQEDRPTSLDVVHAIGMWLDHL